MPNFAGLFRPKLNYVVHQNLLLIKDQVSVEYPDCDQNLSVINPRQQMNCDNQNIAINPLSLVGKFYIKIVKICYFLTYLMHRFMLIVKNFNLLEYAWSGFAAEKNQALKFNGYSQVLILNAAFNPAQVSRLRGGFDHDRPF